MARVFPSPPALRAACLVLVAAACGCDQNMSDTPLPEASAEELSRVAERLSQAPSLSVPAGQTISGTIELAPRVASLTASSDVVFVIARDPESEGPPLAVERLTGNAYPMRFLLDAASAMRPGLPSTGLVQLIVKVDKDGDAGTAGADDLIGFTEGLVAPGDSDVRIPIEGTLGELARALQGREPQGGSADAAAGPDTSSAEAGVSERSGAASAKPGVSRGFGGSTRVTGTIALGAGLASRTAPDDVVFVIAREPGVAGPPVAVARLGGNRYPMAFRLDDSNLMLRGGWPAELELEVRVDEDGDPLTRGPGDLSGRATGPVGPGAAAVRIQLEG
jgi:cytochrome c-type biogenesis protein CcmH